MTGRRHLKQQILSTNALQLILMARNFGKTASLDVLKKERVDHDAPPAIKGGFADSLPPNNRKTRRAKAAGKRGKK